MTVRSGVCLVLALATWPGSGEALVSSPTTCTFAGPGMGVGISVNGRATTVESRPDGIFVNGVYCAEPDLAQSVGIVGGDLADRVTLIGSFAPGYSPENDFDELEVTVALGAGTDTLIFELSDGNDEVIFPQNGMSLNLDPDADFILLSVDIVKVMANGGIDVIHPNNLALPFKYYVYGGDGGDVIDGSPRGDWIYGEGGNDAIYGGGGNDVIDGGEGSDVVSGLDGNDRLLQGPAFDWNDVFYGGPGVDTVDYGARTAPLNVTIGNEQYDDGEVGEQDWLEADIEKVVGGAGNDVLVGTASGNTLTGGAGNDSLYGAGGVDTLYGGDGDDHLVGDAGGDRLWGDLGADTLEGGAGPDTLHGGDGADVLDGGGGVDAYFAEGGDDFLYNDDGQSEAVDCGAGTDDAEPETGGGAVDTFTACEQI